MIKGFTVSKILTLIVSWEKQLRYIIYPSFISVYCVQIVFLTIYDVKL